MATQPSVSSMRSIRIQNALERQKAHDLQTLITSLNNHRKQEQSTSDIEIMNIIKQYFTDNQHDLQSQIQHYTTSKINLIQSTNAEIDRMRYIIQQLNNRTFNTNMISNDNINDSHDQTAPHSPESREKSLTFSPLVLPSPDINIKPLDLDDVPKNFKPRRYSTIPDEYNGKYKIETIETGNGIDFPYPNDKVTVQYTMFAIDGILDLMESYKHEIIDLTSSKCMIGLKYGILSMSVNAKCKLWIPRRLTSYYNDNNIITKQKADILIEIILLNIIRSDVYKNTTYTNDIILNGDKSRGHRSSTVSKTPPPLTPMPLPLPLSLPSSPNKEIVVSPSRKSIEMDEEESKDIIKYSLVIENVDDNKANRNNSIDLNERFPIPDLKGFGGHINHQNTDLELEEHKDSMKVLISQIRQNNNSITMNLATPRMDDIDDDDGKSEYNDSDNDNDNNSETNLLDISGIKSIWNNTYSSMSRNDMIEQCMTLCPKIEACDCTLRLLMILKIYQSIMYNRKQRLWNCSEEIEKDELLSMSYAITDKLCYSNCEIINDFYHCRFYHGHFNRWYDFCRKHYEENYCVYEFIKYDDGDTVTYKRHCSIYKRYHRNKLNAKLLNKRREWFRIDNMMENVSDEEITEIVTLQICDMIHCFVFHSSQEPHLMYAHESLKPKSNFKIKERNTIQTEKFILDLNHLNNNDDDEENEEIFEYDGESFGILISYKDNTYTPQYRSMRDEIINHPTAGMSAYQYRDITMRATIFQQTFIGRQMVNFFGKHINLQQIIAIMCYTNFIDLQKAFSLTLHCHNESDSRMESLRKSHCQLFWHWSKILFSVVDNFGDPIEKDCKFLCKFRNYKSLLMNDLEFHTESIYSATSDKLTFVVTDNGNNGVNDDEVIVVIGAQRLGSLYFDVSLLSDYPHENEVLLGPSEHLEIRNVIINKYDCQIYFGAMYIMDALIGHKLSFNYEEHENYQVYLCDVIKHTLHYIDGQIVDLEFGQKICYKYWENKTKLRWNIKYFRNNISIEQLKKYFLIENELKQISFHFVNTVMLFPNVEQIEINHIDLNVFLCDNLLQLIQILNDENDEIQCGQNLNKIQLFGDENNKNYIYFIKNLFNQYVIKFTKFNWLFQIQSKGNWLFTKQ